MYHFKSVKLSEVCQIESGGTPNSANDSYWNGDINWATLVDVKNKYVNETRRKITKAGLKNSSAKLLPIGTVLFSSRATIGEVSIAAVELATNQGFKNFICNTDKILPEYLYYVLKMEAKNISDLASTTTFKEVSKSKIAEYVIPLPSIEVQKKIVYSLNKAQILIDKRKESLQLLDLYLQSTFLEMFGDPVENSKNMRVIKFGQIIEDIRYGSSRKSLLESEKDSVPILRIPNITKGYINYDNLQYQILPSQEKKKLILQKGDILFVRSNGNPDYIGRCAVFEDQGEYIYASYLIRVRLKIDAGFNPLFVRFCFSMNTYKQKIRKESRTTAGNYNINTIGIKNFDLIKPSIDQQEKFLSIFHETQLLKQKMQKQSIQLENQFQTLMQKSFIDN